MSNEKKKRVDLEALRPPTLDGLLAFEVFPEESDPYEAGPLSITIDPQGITLRWAGERSARWRGSWTDLRKLIESWDLVEKERAAATDELATAMVVLEEARQELAKAKGEAIILPLKPRP